MYKDCKLNKIKNSFYISEIYKMHIKFYLTWFLHECWSNRARENFAQVNLDWAIRQCWSSIELTQTKYNKKDLPFIKCYRLVHIKVILTLINVSAFVNKAPYQNNWLNENLLLHHGYFKTLINLY